MEYTAEELGDELCGYCSLEKKGVYSVPGGYMAGCEGSRCEDALEEYSSHQMNGRIEDKIKTNNMEFYHKDDGYPMSISIETMSVDKMDDDTCLYSSIVMDMETNKVIAEFCHDSLLGRRKWAEGFFNGLKVSKKVSLKGFFTWINEYENLEYTEKGIEFYVNEYLNKK